MNKLNKSLITLGLLAGTPLAMAEVSGSANFTSDYVFRGVTQTAENGAVQMSLDYGHDSGFYAGVWGSTVDFAPGGDEFDNNESLEVDYYLGYASSIGDTGIDYDVSYLYYTYPGADESISYGELTLGASYGSFGVQYAYSDDLFATDETGHYVSGAYDFALPQEITLTVQAGYSFGDAFDSDIEQSATFLPEYLDYSLTLAKTFSGFDLSLSYIDTDISGDFVVKQDQFANDGRVVFSIAKAF
jgi:uncharacterized protein (TIGR02001 family)